GSSARFGNMSSVETEATGFNNLVGRSISYCMVEFDLYESVPTARGSELGREANNRGAAKEPLRSPAQISGRKEVQMVLDGHAALQGLSSIPHLTSVAAGFYRNDVINGSETSAGRACAMMIEFAVAPARLIDNCGRVMGAVIGATGEAMEELDSPYHRCAGRADRARQGAVVALQMR
ncbi:hypothetical protein THAOC_35480, partial [Thalassiosira oceanica]